MKKLLKAPVGVQLSALFLLMLLVLFVVTAPWHILAGFSVVIFGSIAAFTVDDYIRNNHE